MLDPVENGVNQFLEKHASMFYKEKQALTAEQKSNLGIAGLSALAGGLGGYALGDSDLSDKHKSLISSGVLGSLGLGMGATAVASPKSMGAVGAGGSGFTLGSLIGKAIGEKMKSNRDDNELLAQEGAQEEVAPQNAPSQYVDPSSYYSMYNNYGNSPYGQYSDPYANYYQYM